MNMVSKRTIDWDSQIEKLSKYARRKGYNVSILKLSNDQGSICFHYKQIVIPSTITKERQFYTLLHELGHYLINVEHIEEYSKGFGRQYKKFSKKSLTFLVAEIEEELEAWRLGYNLGKRMRLRINRDKFEIFKASLVMTYMSYIAEAKRSRQNVKEE